MQKNLFTLVIVLVVLFLSGCQASEPVSSPKGEPDWQTHESAKFAFSVDYPADWPVTVHGEDHAESPDAGIRLQIGGSPDNRLDIFGQHGTFIMPIDEMPVSSERFQTSGGLNGTVTVYQSGNEVRLVYTIDEKLIIHGRFLGAIATMDKVHYEQQKDVIDRIVETLRYEK